MNCVVYYNNVALYPMNKYVREGLKKCGNFHIFLVLKGVFEMHFGLGTCTKKYITNLVCSFQQ